MKKYELKQREGNPVFRVTITADMNDGDYLTNIDEYTKEKFEGGLLDELLELNKILLEDYSLAEYEEQGYANIPFDTQSGEPCHTLTELKIEYISELGVLFDVKLIGE